MRINVESDLFTDQRFLDMVIELKSVEISIGALVRCWMIAQKFWKNSDNGIPKREWQKQKLNDALITNGLAEDRGDFVFVIGSEVHFAWIRQRSKAGRENKGKSNERRRTEANGRKRDRTSYSYSYSSSLSSSNSSSNSKKEEGARLANAGAFIGSYCRAWKSKYGTNPEIIGKEAGAAKALVKSLGTERATELVESYLAMNEAWFIKKRHDLTTFASNLNSVVQFHDTGTQIYASKAHEVERGEANADTWDRAAQLVNKKLGTAKW